VGPFKEEGEGTGVARDVVKAQNEDLATPGLLKRNDPATVTIHKYWVNKRKQHTRHMATCLYPVLDVGAAHTIQMTHIWTVSWQDTCVEQQP